jgi:hypothetical protein
LINITLAMYLPRRCVLPNRTRARLGGGLPEISGETLRARLQPRANAAAGEEAKRERAKTAGRLVPLRASGARPGERNFSLSGNRVLSGGAGASQISAPRYCVAKSVFRVRLGFYESVIKQNNRSNERFPWRICGHFVKGRALSGLPARLSKRLPAQAAFD